MAALTLCRADGAHRFLLQTQSFRTGLSCAVPTALVVARLSGLCRASKAAIRERRLERRVAGFGAAHAATRMARRESWRCGTDDQNVNFTPNCMVRALVFMNWVVRNELLRVVPVSSDASIAFSGITPVTEAGVRLGENA
jgi:hypothetical protein